MNIRMLALTFSILLAVAPAMGQVKHSPDSTRALERAELLKSAQRGKTVTIGGERYEFLPEVRAIEHAPRRESAEQAIAKLGAGGGTYIETKGRYVLFRAAQAKRATIERTDGTAVYPAVLNTRTGALGVLPGTLAVKPVSMGDAAGLAAQHGLEIVREFPQLQTVFYRVKPGGDVLDAAAALAADPRVESVRPEIVERVRKPR